jgi:hypothetical protein
VSVEVTPRAVEVLRRSFEVARLDPSSYGVRLRRTAHGAQTQFAEAPEPGDEVLEAGGIRLFVAPAIAKGAVTIDASEEHDQIVVR